MKLDVYLSCKPFEFASSLLFPFPSRIIALETMKMQQIDFLFSARSFCLLWRFELASLNVMLQAFRVSGALDLFINETLPEMFLFTL